MPRRQIRETSDAEQRIGEAMSLLGALGMPNAQQNERSALALLALLGLQPATPWSEATAPTPGITPLTLFFEQRYGPWPSDGQRASLVRPARFLRAISPCLRCYG